MVARNSTICARAVKVRAQRAPAQSSPRIGVIFMVVTTEQTRGEPIGTPQKVTTWSGFRNGTEPRAHFAGRAGGFRRFGLNFGPTPASNSPLHDLPPRLVCCARVDGAFGRMQKARRRIL